MASFIYYHLLMPGKILSITMSMYLVTLLTNKNQQQLCYNAIAIAIFTSRKALVDIEGPDVAEEDSQGLSWPPRNI